MLRLTALAALALTPPAFVYVIATRYHLVLWLLAAIVSAAWLKEEGLPLIDRRWPHWRDAVGRMRIATHASRAIAWLRPS